MKKTLASTAAELLTEQIQGADGPIDIVSVFFKRYWDDDVIERVGTDNHGEPTWTECAFEDGFGPDGSGFYVFRGRIRPVERSNPIEYEDDEMMEMARRAGWAELWDGEFEQAEAEHLRALGLIA